MSNSLYETEEEKRRRLAQQQTTQSLDEMTTRDALEHAYAKANPNGGYVTMTGPLGDFSFYDEDLNTNKGNNKGRYIETNTNIPLFDEDVVSKNNSYMKNMANWLKEKDRISKLKISDENKHQYMSCLSGKGGAGTSITGSIVGVGKEINDIVQKLSDNKLRDDYGGWKGVVYDSMKDMKNNIIGLKHAYDGCSDCQALLYNKK